MTDARDDEELFQVHLDMPLMSKRGIRFRELPHTLVQKIETQVAAEAEKTDTPYIVRLKQVQECCYLMVREVTEEAGLASLQGEGVKWRRVQADDLRREWTKLFRSRESEMIKQIYNRYHECTTAEVDVILGKVLPVASSA